MSTNSLTARYRAIVRQYVAAYTAAQDDSTRALLERAYYGRLDALECQARRHGLDGCAALDAALCSIGGA